jgi:hypothetical protein
LGGDPDVQVLVSVAAFGLLATIPRLDDAVLALGVQPTLHGSQVWIVLSTYGSQQPPAETVERLSRHVQRALGVVPTQPT